MGRKSHNKTYEQVLEESRARANAYYQLNKEKVKRKKLQRYYELKNKSKK